MAKQGTVLISGMDVARVAHEAGFTGEHLTTAVAVAKAESSWYRDGISSTNDWGLWQINKTWHPEYFGDGGDRLLYDIKYNAQAAFEIWGGQNSGWAQWYTHTPAGEPPSARAPGGRLFGTGPYRQHLTNAAFFVNAYLGGGSAQLGVPPGVTPATSEPAAVAAKTAPPWKPASIDFAGGPEQENFDERQIRVIDKLTGGNLWTGAIEPLDPAIAGPGDSPYIYTSNLRTLVGDVTRMSKHSLWFMFNPYEIAIDYSGNPDILPIAALDKAQAIAALPIPSNTSISFMLYFDRTYEVMEGGKKGVLTDVQQLEFLTGIRPHQPTMLLNPLKFLLGKPTAFHFNAIVQSFDVSYNHFSENMVPMRCEVMITAQRISSTVPFASKAATEIYGSDDWQTQVLADPSKAQAALGLGPAK